LLLANERVTLKGEAPIRRTWLGTTFARKIGLLPTFKLSSMMYLASRFYASPRKCECTHRRASRRPLTFNSLGMWVVAEYRSHCQSGSSVVMGLRPTRVRSSILKYSRKARIFFQRSIVFLATLRNARSERQINGRMNCVNFITEMLI